MPGIFGYKKHENSCFLKNMADAIKMDYDFWNEKPFSDEYIEQSAMHLGNGNLSFTDCECDLRLEGESYNWKTVSAKFNIKATSFANLLVKAHKTGLLKQVLNIIDGYFCASLYDIKNRKILLFSDRWGMRFLYYYKNGNNFAFASEVKGILALPFINKDLNPESINCFMDIGYLLDEFTWFKHITLLKPSSILEYDIETSQINMCRYWRWSEIKSEKISYNDALFKLSDLFLKSVNKRFNPNEKIGISLSGGLDSRAIFAAVNKIYPDYEGYCYTFGKKGCSDIEIAKKVVKKTNWKHQVFEISSQNWFRPRIEKVWKTDGLMDLLHMHGSEFLEEIKSNCDINLNGYAGDAITGSSFIAKGFLNKRISDCLAKKYYRSHTNLADISNDYYDINNVFPNLFANRVRRFTTMGSINALFYVDQRKPFLDNDLMEFIFSLPDSYRLHNKIYSESLLLSFPDFFENIPWQKTGFPISRQRNFRHEILYFFKRVFKRLKIFEFSPDNYTDYKNWIKEESVSQILIDLLNNEKSLYTKHTDINFGQTFLIPHLEGKNDYSNLILRAATIEIYLRKIANFP
ncbi:MAG: asparagine synthase-related protein [Candidatus Gastranaerophilales bacterium]|nr:asparagine synthase-related protein [Candidatus Gastranaerophilales bacterium]